MSKTSIKLFYENLPIIDNKGKVIGNVARPIVDLIMNYKHGKMVGPIRTLIDSGSDYNLFPAEIASILGIKLAKGVLKITEGIGGKTVKTYRHTGIKIFIEDHSFETSVDFGEDITVPLLGQQGFFDKVKQIAFNRQKEEIIISI